MALKKHYDSICPDPGMGGISQSLKKKPNKLLKVTNNQRKGPSGTLNNREQLPHLWGGKSPGNFAPQNISLMWCKALSTIQVPFCTFSEQLNPSTPFLLLLPFRPVRAI